MDDRAYTPAGGVTGRLRRVAARLLACAPLDIELGRSVVTFTFDDFPKSAGTLAAERLEREDWRATYFTAGGFAGEHNHHGALFDADDLQRLSAAGHEIACHTFSHADAGTTSAAEYIADIDRNAAFLKSSGHTAPLQTFAFPYGEATPAMKRTLSKRFRALRGVRPGVNRGRADRALLKSVPLDGGLTGLQRAIDAVRDAHRKPGWLIFYGHDVQDRPTDWGCTPDFLDAVIEAVKASGARVLTMAEALDHMEGEQE
jgi:peptidoglycan/xylan/chitin deacetylase (PgdA/CDA1 family)